MLWQCCEERALAYELTVSMGHSVTMDEKESVDQLINRADQALYSEKHLYHGWL